MLRVIVAGLVGAVVLFVWGFVSWAVLSWHETDGYRLPDEPAVVSALKSSIPDSSDPGLYWFPAPADTEGASAEVQTAANDAWVEAHKAGPIGFLVYRPAGADPMEPMMMVRGFGISFLSALLASILVAVSAIGSYGGRVVFVLALGLFAVLIRDVVMWNYMHMPTDYTLVNVADSAVGWLTAGVVIGAIVKGKKASR